MWFADLDVDGWGDDASIVAVDCLGPVGSVERGGDCDDTDVMTHPSATEVCTDGRDNDCDGVDCPLIEASTGVWYMGWDLDPTGDITGDGIDDLLSGAPYDDAGGSAAGVTHILAGPYGGALALAASITGSGVGDMAGYRVLSEDIDGDGLVELLIGSPMPSTGAGALSRIDTPLASDVKLPVADMITGTGYIGMAFEVTPDITGDGAPDLVMSDYDGGLGYIRVLDADFSGSVRAASGGAYIHGSDIGTIGLSFSVQHDLDGDGMADLWGGTRWDAWYDGDPGDVVMYAGPLVGIYRAARDADVHIAATDGASSYFGFVADTAPDLDGDGLADALATGDETAYLFSGATAGITDETMATITFQYAFGMGPGAFESGDFNGDGNVDIAMAEGTGYESYGLSYGPTVIRVWYGPIGGPVAGEPDAAVTVTDPSYLGMALANPGDVDGSGRDALFTSGLVEDGSTFIGAVYLLAGASWP